MTDLLWRSASGDMNALNVLWVLMLPFAMLYAAWQRFTNKKKHD